jgi:signal transduction histidine kinase
LSCAHTGGQQTRICERVLPDGTVRWDEVHASPIFNAAGELAQVVEVWRDISERRAAEARLSESHRLASLGLLATGFSHELNTPLGTVLMCVEGILRDAQTAGAASPEWEHIGQRAVTAREQVLRCRGVTQHFLRMSRGQGSSLDIVDLHAAVAASTRLIEPTARAHGVCVVLPAAFAGLHVRADEAELQHVVINLLLNAIQASPPGAEVTLELARGDPMRVRVVDRGCGIAAADQARIFEPFFSMRNGGTGLGLFLSLDFTRRWGGSLSVTSEVGVGSTFELSIPAATPQEVRQTA